MCKKIILIFKSIGEKWEFEKLKTDMLGVVAILGLCTQAECIPFVINPNPTGYYKWLDIL